MSRKILLASFDNVAQATNVYNHLVDEEKYNSTDVSVIATETVREEFDEQVHEESQDNLGIGEGILKGGVAGGLIGLLVSAVPLAIPGLPALLVVGPLASILGLTGVAATTTTGVTTGAVAGGLVGALTNIDINKDKAKAYETTISEGGVLLAVPIDSGHEQDRIHQIMEDNGADNIQIGTVQA